MKAVQITTMSKSLFILMDDGTVWEKSNCGTFAEGKWNKIELPLEEEKKNDET